MKRSRIAFSAMLGLVAAIQVAGCSPPGWPPGDGTPSDTRVVALPQHGKSCVKELLGNGGRWTLERDGIPGERPEKPRLLHRLCKYRWIARTPGGTPDVRPFASTALFAEKAVERNVVRALGSASPTHADALRRAGARLDVQAEATDVLPASSNAKVWVGFPDTSRAQRPEERTSDIIPLGSPGGGGIEGNPHGFNIAWINRRLTCRGSGACVTSPRTTLAMRNGDKGTRHELADAIKALVDNWVTDPTGKNAGHPLIINIAAGWEPAYECLTRLPEDALIRAGGGPHQGREPRPGSMSAGSDFSETSAIPKIAPHFGEEDPTHVVGDEKDRKDRELTGRIETEPLPFATTTSQCSATSRLTFEAQMVLQELEVAACHGALIIAAAGNDPLVSPQRVGPMLPAAWETRPAPDAARCAALGAPAPPAPPAGTSESTYRPLLYAATGVNDNDTPVVLTRQDGIARLAAPASLLAGFPTVPTDAGYSAQCGLPTPVAGGGTGSLCDRSYAMTGSSVASTVVSAAAATAWFYHPGWTAHQVMAHVYQEANSANLTIHANFALGATALTTTEPVHRVSICRVAQASVRGSLGCSTADSTRPYNNGAAPTTPYRATLIGSYVLENAPHGEVDPQPGFPCPECRVVKPLNHEDYWYVWGQIPVEAFSTLGATSIRIAGVATQKTALLDAHNEVLGDGTPIQDTSTPTVAGYSMATSTTDGASDTWTPTSTATSYPLAGQFKSTEYSFNNAEHVVVLFEKQNGSTAPWTSAAQEVEIVPP